MNLLFLFYFIIHESESNKLNFVKINIDFIMAGKVENAIPFLLIYDIIFIFGNVFVK